ncbi:hypothetical protein DH2020_009521 [Rehmannia glutinosa]|uniref:Rad21/Rec8-like protein C-terminal eukaryotic domain-containing protein n=1 Tax=Rehmannia glutinosa TaxID=99300 RepID=A0ABR0X6J5_REHGL
MDQDLFVGSSSNMNISLSSHEVLRGASFSLEDRLDPIVLDEAEEVQMHNKQSNEDQRTNFPVPSLEIVRGTGFCLEDRLDPMMLGEAEKEQLNDRPFNDNITSNFGGPVQELEFDSVAKPSPQGSESVASLGILHKNGFSFEQSPNFKMLNEAEKGQGHDEPSDKEHRVEEEHVEHLRTQLNFQEDEPRDFTGSVDNAQPVGAKKLKVLEVITPDSVKCPRPDPAGVGTPEVVTVRTPAPKERAKILKKRKALFDFTTTVPNKVFKSWLEEDPSDLKRERREVPQTLLHAWRARKLMHVPQSFFEPSIPGISIDLECKKSDAASIKLVGQDGLHSPVTHVVCEQIAEIGSPVTQRSPDIAPGTPVTHLNSLRLHEAGAAVADSDMLEPTTSVESVENSPSSSEALELDVAFREVHTLQEQGMIETLSQSLADIVYYIKDNFDEFYLFLSRMIGSYLGRKFLDKKRRNKEQVLNLSHLLAGKTKKESARLFYEILVLKTMDCIDVQQENAYDDIFVCETSKLKQASESRI